ncbi:hypothetical protein CTheo_2076 [Ceratobasidium theobromae]|uniref:Uncharacterized protein n=1 Tax=Ceratobasidium theobromae TaxID=1582974 RepID=A0A5N5QRS4_9AGAM|nr:hypothetical protein CTheo_2076 [Ceratobasidium theobromae]
MGIERTEHDAPATSDGIERVLTNPVIPPNVQSRAIVNAGCADYLTLNGTPNESCHIAKNVLDEPSTSAFIYLLTGKSKVWSNESLRNAGRLAIVTKVDDVRIYDRAEEPSICSSLLNHYTAFTCTALFYNMPTTSLGEADAKFPSASKHGIPPSPSRENPGQVYPKSDPNPEQKLGPSGPAFDAQQHEAHLREQMDPEMRAGDSLTTQEGGLYTD